MSAIAVAPTRMLSGVKSWNTFREQPRLERETKYVSNAHYFGEPVYKYSLKQGIEDGFLAPYKVIRIDIDKDIEGWTPPPGMIDDLGAAIPSREYNQIDMDRILILNQRTRLVARRVMQYLNATDPF